MGSLKKIQLYDTTLRDGSQGEGISFSVKDKLNIACKLDKLGVHYIEGGWPGSNPKDMEFFTEVKRLRFRTARIAAFGSTRRARMTAAKDPQVKALIKSGAEVITIFGKSWDLHVKDVFRISLEENTKMINDTVRYLKSKKREVIFDAEHFFDGYVANPDYAVSSLLVAQNAGADTITLCDTNGGMLTSQIAEIIREVRKVITVRLGIHVHNDGDMAVANSVAAIQAGCRHVQGTINGYGERCGNANLCSIIANLELKLGFSCLGKNRLKDLTEASRYIAETSNMRQLNSQPFVGVSAFAHKGGVHVNAVMKNPITYEHHDPALVGNRRRVLVSELSGRTTLLMKAQEMELSLQKDTPQAKQILDLLQDLEHQGYHFEAAEASFELLLKRALKKYKPFFELDGFRVIIEKREAGDVISEATIKVKVDKVAEHTASEGGGPVNALDNALRKALEEFYPSLAEMHLSDFKVRVLEEKAGTAARVRVLIQSQDATSSWTTVGVSEDIIQASWNALVDSVEYKLLKDTIKPPKK